MIYIGVTGWGDHDSLYPETLKTKDKLAEYSSHFPVVELDASFYAVQPEHNMTKWVNETPANFRFVVKAYQGMTGHKRESLPFTSKQAMFDAFKTSLQPIIQENKLATVLFQFPPWFDCRKENVDYLRFCKKQMDDIPVALEFRNQSWFRGQMKDETLNFMKQAGWIHTIVDEPQAGEGSSPTVPIVTDDTLALVRMHGRNRHGWNRPKNDTQNWRDVRYLYHYNRRELLEWQDKINQLAKQVRDVIVLFNNNSGGDAAGNAKTFQHMLAIEYEGLAARQMRLF